MAKNNPTKKEYNILLLGQTGVGKSTFINSFANYLTCNTIQSANDGFISLIPSSFTVTDENFKKTLVKCGEHINESNIAGQSATQSCKGYVFTFEDYIVRLIDTPGVGDTRGIDHDNMNFDNILSYIGQLEELHAICILLKPNESRITVTFEFCIKQLLCHLEKSASNNIIFIFTNSRSSFYRPGDTIEPLTSLLDIVKNNPPHVYIPIEKNNVFCFDSEAFRFLVARKNGMKFDDNDQNNFAQSWVKSSEECHRLMGIIMNLKPHKVKDTVSVNEARRVIVLLSQPIADIAKNLQDNLRVLEKQEKEIKESMNDIEKLKMNLHIPIIDLKITKYDEPRTVCTARDCCEIVKVGNAIKYHYKQKCHDPCYLTSIQREIIGDVELRNCAAMRNSGFLGFFTNGDVTCKICNCSYKLHMHIYYDTEPQKVDTIDTTIQERIKTVEDAKKEAELIVEGLRRRYMSLQDENDMITKSTAKFAHFLKNNAIVQYNDTYKNYLQHLIENEKNSFLNTDTKIINGLESMLSAHEQQKKILEDAINNTYSLKDNGRVSVDDVFKTIENLFNLSLNGKKLKETFEAQKGGRQLERNNLQEIVVTPKGHKSFSLKKFLVGMGKSVKDLFLEVEIFSPEHKQFQTYNNGNFVHIEPSNQN